MKKILTSLLILLLSFAFFSCSDPSGGGSSDSVPNTVGSENTGSSTGDVPGGSGSEGGGTGQSFTVTYVLDGGINNPDNPSVYTIEDIGSTILLKDPVKIAKKETGDSLGNGLFELTTTTYTFDGWYTDNAFEHQVTELSLSLGTVTLYAKWSASSSTSTVPYKRIDADGTANASGEYILFGEYPQTKVTDNLGGYDSNTWTSYGYYINGEVNDDFMKYTDKEYNDEKYRGVYFTEYRPYLCSDSSSAEHSYQDDNGYEKDKIYWFKYEPIKWRILNEANGEALIFCDIAIDSQAWDYKGGENCKNNYAKSTIRKWLNDTFYNTAFSGLQQELIQDTTVDNSVDSTGYGGNQFACENTNDKVFLLSYADVTNSAYGFNSDKKVYDEERQKKSSDYAKSQGCYKDTDNEGYKGNCIWWLRSPCHNKDSEAHIVNILGSVYDHFDCVNDSKYSILPALTIWLQ